MKQAESPRTITVKGTETQIQEIIVTDSTKEIACNLVAGSCNC